jgi:CxxC motif-containing protein (DUF1111 family)
MFGNRFDGRPAGGVLGLTIACALFLCIGAGADAPDQTLRNHYPGTPIQTLTREQLGRFDSGGALFAKMWGPEDGLGPSYNSTSCANCHHLPLPGGNEIAAHTFVARSPTCQDMTKGHTCGRFRIVEHGQIEQLPIPKGATFRKPQSLYGLGMLEAVPTASLLKAENSQRKGPDAVAGRVGRTAAGEVGKFGWEAQFSTLREFVASALAIELGLRNGPYLNDGSGPAAPEVDAIVVDRLTDFTRMLAAPPLTDRGDVSRGRALFDRARCSACHSPRQRTGISELPQLRNIVFAPYTDMLLHDVGTTGGVWLRTPPLWGLNASGPPYLHDASANSVEEAILRHAGQASAATTRYLLLSAGQRQELLRFLDSL